MKKKFKLGVIGAGFMATSIIKGAINSKTISPEEIIVSDINESSLEKISLLGVSTTIDNVEIANSSEFVLFAIKPQESTKVLQTIQNSSCKKFISIMAGVKKDKIKSFINDSMVARCMPNTPCSINSGAIGIDYSDFAEEKDIDFIKDVFSSLGVALFVEEKNLGAVTGVSGSAPAYFYLFLDGIIKAGIKCGLDEKTAKSLATATMIGAGKMVEANSDKSLEDLINAVCSKGGTTIQAVNVYKENNLENITLDAINACVKRSEELENI